MTEGGALTGLIITAAADHLILLSLVTLRHNGAQDKLPKLPTPQKELLYRLGEAHVLDPTAGPQALIQSAAAAARAVAGKTYYVSLRENS